MDEGVPKTEFSSLGCYSGINFIDYKVNQGDLQKRRFQSMITGKQKFAL